MTRAEKKKKLNLMADKLDEVANETEKGKLKIGQGTLLNLDGSPRCAMGHVLVRCGFERPYNFFSAVTALRHAGMELNRDAETIIADIELANDSEHTTVPLYETFRVLAQKLRKVYK